MSYIKENLLTSHQGRKKNHNNHSSDEFTKTTQHNGNYKHTHTLSKTTYNKHQEVKRYKNSHTLSKITYNKHQKVKRYKNLVQEKTFMHQYI